jgi:hypothetical protein
MDPLLRVSRNAGVKLDQRKNDARPHADKKMNPALLRARILVSSSSILLTMQR